MCFCGVTEAFLASAGTRLTDFTARNLSNSLWALAKMGHNPGEAMLNAMAAEVAKKLDGCNAQNLVGSASHYVCQEILLDGILAINGQDCATPWEGMYQTCMSSL